MDITTIIGGVVMFTGVVMLLVAVIIAAQAKLVSSGNVSIEINDDPENAITVPAGGKLLDALASAGIYLSSACGGGGTCAQCKCRVLEGGGSMLPTEEGHFTLGEARNNWRLSCQVAVKQDMKIEVDPNGYIQIREGRGRDLGRRIALHRLNAYAWGSIDDLGTKLEVDHKTPAPRVNAEWNLEAVTTEKHAQRTRARERRRKSRSRSLSQFAEPEGQVVGQ